MKMKIEVIDTTPKFKNINDLVEQSFGKGFRGNYSVYDPYCALIEEDKLNYIGRRGFFSNKCVGRFIVQDGSKLAVCEDYLNHAKKYAELYEKNQKKEVTIMNVA